MNTLTITWNGQTLRFVQTHAHEWQQVSDYRDQCGRIIATTGYHNGFSDSHPIVRASSAAIARAVWRELARRPYADVWAGNPDTDKYWAKEL